MNTLFKFLVTGVAMLVLSACASKPNIHTDYNPDYDFSQIKTYYLSIDHNKDYRSQQGVSLVDQRIEKAIRENLNARGYTEVAKEQADTLVSYHVTTKDRVRVRNYNNNVGYSRYGYGYGYGYGHYGSVGYGTQTEVQNYQEGILLIDMVDPTMKKVVWRGQGSKKIDKSLSTQEFNVILNEYITALFNKIPGQNLQ